MSIFGNIFGHAEQSGDDMDKVAGRNEDVSKGNEVLANNIAMVSGVTVSPEQVRELAALAGLSAEEIDTISTIDTQMHQMPGEEVTSVDPAVLESLRTRLTEAKSKLSN